MLHYSFSQARCGQDLDYGYYNVRCPFMSSKAYRASFMASKPAYVME